MSMINYAGRSSAYDISPLFRAGLRGYSRMRQNAAVQKMLPVGANDITSMRVQALQRQVARISPNIENFNLAPSAISCTANATTVNDNSITSSVLSSSEFGIKYLGDKFRNISLLLRINFSELLNTARVIVYIPKVPGDGISSIDFQSIPDETRYTILSDSMLFPKHTSQSRKNFLIKRVNLKGRMTTVDRTAPTSGTVRTCDVRVVMILENTTASAVNVYPWYQLRFQNK